LFFLYVTPRQPSGSHARTVPGPLLRECLHFPFPSSMALSNLQPPPNVSPLLLPKSLFSAISGWFLAFIRTVLSTSFTSDCPHTRERRHALLPFRCRRPTRKKSSVGIPAHGRFSDRSTVPLAISLRSHLPPIMIRPLPSPNSRGKKKQSASSPLEFPQDHLVSGLPEAVTRAYTFFLLYAPCLTTTRTRFLFL